MQELEFKRLIEKYQHGELSGNEKALLDEWFERLENDTHPATWTKQDKAKLKHKILKQISGGEKTTLFADHQQPFLSHRRFWNNVFRAAASFLLIATLSYTLWHFAAVEEPGEIATRQISAQQEISKVILSDGSIVWVKRNSTLTYPEEFGQAERHVTLQGEALFEVAKDPARPFIIQCNGLTTTVLGTSFNIRTGKKDIEVVVLTGKVFLTSENDRQGVIVLPNEKAVYTVEEKRIAKITEEIPKETKAIAVDGTDYSMYFEDTPMEEVIRRVEDKFNVKIYTRNPEIANCIITADFTGQSLELTLNMIAQALGFDFEIDESMVILRGPGCHK